MTSPRPGAGSERPLWLIAMLYVVHTVLLVLCGLWIPRTYGDAIVARFHSPLFILPAIIFAYAFVPLVASFSALGREYWDLVGRGGSAGRAAAILFLLGAACTAGLAVLWRVAS